MTRLKSNSATKPIQSDLKKRMDCNKLHHFITQRYLKSRGRNNRVLSKVSSLCRTSIEVEIYPENKKLLGVAISQKVCQL